MIAAVDQQLEAPAPVDGERRDVELAKWAPTGAKQVMIVCKGSTEAEVRTALAGRGSPDAIIDTDDRFLAAIAWLDEQSVLGVVQFGQAYNWSEDPADWYWVPCPVDFPRTTIQVLPIESTTIALEYDDTKSVPSWYLASDPSAPD